MKALTHFCPVPKERTDVTSFLPLTYFLSPSIVPQTFEPLSKNQKEHQRLIAKVPVLLSNDSSHCYDVPTARANQMSLPNTIYQLLLTQ